MAKTLGMDMICHYDKASHTLLKYLDRRINSKLGNDTTSCDWLELVEQLVNTGDYDKMDWNIFLDITPAAAIVRWNRNILSENYAQYQEH